MESVGGNDPDRVFRRARAVHIVGIGGAGTRGLARILVAQDVRVTGSDRVLSPALEALRALGVPARLGHGAGHVPPDADVVVRSAAVPDDNPEIVEARRRSIPCRKYAEAAGWLTRRARTVAVAGTHGKTTTTAMAARILDAAGLEPGVLVGGDFAELGGGARWGDPFVLEACEYDRSFLTFSPHAAVITNIEAEHLDVFRDIGEIRRAFAAFLGRLPRGGTAIVGRRALCGAIREAARERELALEACGAEADCTWRIRRLEPLAEGVRFALEGPTGPAIPLELGVPGLHNAGNAAAAAAVSLRMGADPEAVRRGLAGFRGVRRRFEIVSRRGGITIVDDYAHHPTEVRAVLDAARRFARGGRVRAVFQPHQHSRLRRFLHGFARALARADDCIVTDIYAARDPLSERGISSRELVRVLERMGRSSVYCGDARAAGRRVRRTAREGDVILLLGAGDITNVARELAASPPPGGGGEGR